MSEPKCGHAIQKLWYFLHMPKKHILERHLHRITFGNMVFFQNTIIICKEGLGDIKSFIETS